MNLPDSANTAAHHETLCWALYAARSEKLAQYARATAEPRPLEDLIAERQTPREIALLNEINLLNDLISEICRGRDDD